MIPVSVVIIAIRFMILHDDHDVTFLYASPPCDACLHLPPRRLRDHLGLSTAILQLNLHEGFTKLFIVFDVLLHCIEAMRTTVCRAT